jgi:hypothetical protein
VLDLALGGVEDFEGLLQVGRLRGLLVEQLIDAHHLLVDGLEIFLLRVSTNQARHDTHDTRTGEQPNINEGDEAKQEREEEGEPAWPCRRRSSPAVARSVGAWWTWAGCSSA